MMLTVPMMKAPICWGVAGSWGDCWGWARWLQQVAWPVSVLVKAPPNPPLPRMFRR
jgi:hypothetical protein